LPVVKACNTTLAFYLKQWRKHKFCLGAQMYEQYKEFVSCSKLFYQKYGTFGLWVADGPLHNLATILMGKNHVHSPAFVNMIIIFMCTEQRSKGIATKYYYLVCIIKRVSFTLTNIKNIISRLDQYVHFITEEHLEF
jgi:hypothetical protein